MLTDVQSCDLLLRILLFSNLEATTTLWKKGRGRSLLQHSQVIPQHKVFSTILYPAFNSHFSCARMWAKRTKSVFFSHPHNLYNLLSCFSFIILYRFSSSALNLSPSPSHNESFSLFSQTTLRTYPQTSPIHTEILTYLCTSSPQLMLQLPIDSQPQAYEVWCYFIFNVIDHNHPCKSSMVLHWDWMKYTVTAIFVKPINCKYTILEFFQSRVLPRKVFLPLNP